MKYIYKRERARERGIWTHSTDSDRAGERQKKNAATTRDISTGEQRQLQKYSSKNDQSIMAKLREKHTERRERPKKKK